ncbi:Gastric triacylglycerol lipase [Thelohanellus kitauei]|uniref:Gastric triacylglycerol lipase n=1 Tax=Thelohanellus kitauei TaxID=669202 RepID=A0A0C2MZY7_THEKT|nr:Gastric triacylglycerol lipase [Thelohanellus kitauei]
MIKYILHATNTDKITYIGHSQGSLILLAALSNNPKLNRLINCCFALGPASRLANIKGLFSMSPKFLRYIMVRNNAEPRPFMFMNENRTKYLYKMLMMLPYTLCLKLLMQVTGNNPKDFDKSQFKDVLLNVPSPTSVKNIQHFLQMVDSKRFTKYDYGEERNRKHYGQFTAPEYNLKTISIPVYLFSGEEDYLTTPEDIDWLANQLQNAKLFRYQRTAHLDYVIGKFSSVDIFEKIIELLTENETNTVNTPSAIEVK